MRWLLKLINSHIYYAYIIIFNIYYYNIINIILYNYHIYYNKKI